MALAPVLQMLIRSISAILALPALLFAQIAPQAPWGTMVGEVDTTSAIAWVRTDRPAKVTLRIATNTTLTGARLVGTKTSVLHRSVKFRVTQLKPATRYYFRFRLEDPTNARLARDTPLATFVTAPDRGQTVRFAWSADCFVAARFRVASDVATVLPDFYLSLGDMPYADGAKSVLEYDAMHALVRKNVDLRSMLRSTTCYAIFDDHEILNDWDAATPSYLVKAGLESWHEWMPLLLPAPRKFYRSFAHGKNLRVIMLDTRSYRARNASPDTPKHTILGTQQRAWLLQELKAAKETFKVIVSSVPFRSGTKQRDDWEGYQHERRILFDFIRDNDIANVVLLTGDHHIASIVEHPEGIVEAIAGPLSATVGRAPLDREPFMRRAASDYNFGQVEVLDTSPPEMHIQLRSPDAILFRKEIQARTPGSVEFAAGLGDARFHAAGPHSIQFRGTSRHFTRAPSGKYRVTAGTRNGVRAVMPPCDLDLREGGYASVGVLTPVSDALYRQRLFSEDFSVDGKMPKNVAIADAPGAIAGPSSWFVDGGRLWQSSEIQRQGKVLATSILIGSSGGQPILWGDQVLRARVRTWGYLGTTSVLFRATDAQNAYVFELGPTGRRLLKLVNGSLTELAKDQISLPVWHTLDIECRAIGAKLEVFVDGESVFTATDRTHAAGRVGFGGNDHRLMSVEQLRVFSAPPPEDVILADRFAEPKALQNWTVFDAGRASRWVVTGGALRQTNNASGNSATRSGTTALRKNGVFGDASLSFRIAGATGRGVGAVFRAKSQADGYRFQMDGSAGFVRLERLVAGQPTVLAQADVVYEPLRFYDVEILADGPEMRVRLDGHEVLTAIDKAYTTGSYGLFTYDEINTLFDNVVVRKLATDAAWTRVVGKDRQFEVTYHATRGSASVMLAVLSEGEAPPISAVSHMDPLGRLLPVRFDTLFNLSVGLGVLLVFDAQGSTKMPLAFPSDPFWKGRRVVASGLRWDGKRFLPLASAPVRPD